ncbi:30S ribosomal protein S15 [Candidatus Woesearchaeota archaeon]|nr:30S ribosomal protein S15 [Candidatus Woesearchaeota archaeon]
MARKYSGARGQSGSTRPSKRVAPGWIQHKTKEIELLVVKLAKEGKSASMIGLQLRDTYGIPDVKAATGKSISKILADKKLSKDIPEDLMSLIRKAVLVRKHIGENKQDMTAKRGLQLTESKIKKLIKYYKTIGRLPLSWKYDPERIKLVVE